MSRSMRTGRRTFVMVAVLLAPLLVACGGDDAADTSAGNPTTDVATETPTETVATPTETTETPTEAAASSSGGDDGTLSTATVVVDGQTLDFSGSFCFGSVDNWAFIGATADNTGSFEIQATADTSQQQLRLVVDETYLGGVISNIDLGTWNASGSATLDDGSTIDFDVTCAQ